MGSLEGKVAAVTGASSGIGQRIAETLGSAGAHVFLCGRSAEAMAASKAKIEAAGGRATVSVFDIRDADRLTGFVESAAAAGGLHIMVNNAGLGHQDPIVEGNPAHWREMFEVNVLALLTGCQAAVRVMRRHRTEGRIINISSTASLNRQSGVYGATKQAVNQITSTLREELQDDSIRVTSILPGVFMSNFIRNFDPVVVKGIAASVGIADLAFEAGDKLPQETLDTVRRSMSAMVGDPQEIANLVRYIVTQPIGIGFDEVVIRPGKNLPF